MTFGFSRDDAGKFLNYYYENKIYESDPFAHLDQKGVGKLIEMSVKLGRQTRPNLGLGICGEHGGDPTSVEFCDRVGLDYVSCSPFRVPIARLPPSPIRAGKQPHPPPPGGGGGGGFFCSLQGRICYNEEARYTRTGETGRSGPWRSRQ